MILLIGPPVHVRRQLPLVLRERAKSVSLPVIKPAFRHCFDFNNPFPWDGAINVSADLDAPPNNCEIDCALGFGNVVALRDEMVYDRAFV